MTYMLIHVLLGVMPTDYSLSYVALNQNTSKGMKNAAQDASVALEAITIEVNAKFCKLLSMR